MKGIKFAIEEQKKRTPAEIAVFTRGFGLKYLAQITERSPNFICQVVKGQKRSRRIEAIIARAVGGPVEKLFPGHGWPRGKHRKGVTL